MTEIALCLNAGSSSLKFALFRATKTGEEKLAVGNVERLGTPAARVTLHVGESVVERAAAGAGIEQALRLAFELSEERGLPAPTVVGHRIVHGGARHVAPERVDESLIRSLKELVPLAPLHLPSGIACIEAVIAHRPNVAQVACFDTAFHARMPEVAARFALPKRWFDDGVRRYGFHGLSYEYILSLLGEPPPARVIVAHLGNGASLAAIQDGRSIDTSMGFTPSGGIPMGTRSGDLDPGIVLYFLREKGLSVAALEQLLERESGLSGVGGSADVRTLEQRAGTDVDASIALELFAYEVRKRIGGYVAALGGLDCLVFTGGIGEHSAFVRAASCQGLEALGIALETEKNARHEREIHAPGSRRVFVLATDEERMIARHAFALVHAD